VWDRIEDPFLGALPPPLPVPLRAERSREIELDEDARWLASLPPATRAVLEAAKQPRLAWPFAPRLEGAIARPS
jgi:hypothetical protein